MTTGVQISGVNETATALSELPRDMAIQVQERVLRQAGWIAAYAAKRIHPPERRTGMWEESIGVKLWPAKAERTMFNVVMAIAGPQRGAQYEDRANIAHLLEFGWRTVKRGTGTLARESGRAASTSQVTGRAGEGVEAGRVEGYRVFGKAAAETEGAIRQHLVIEIPRAVERAWKRLSRRAGNA